MSKNESVTGVRDGFMKHSKSSSILPSPAMLESYEEISPGIVDKLVELVEKEQKHRHALEEKSVKYRVFLERHHGIFLKVLNIITLLIILLLSFLITQKTIIGGTIIGALSMIALLMTSKQSPANNMIAKSKEQESDFKPFRHSNNRRRFYKKNHRTS